VRMMPGGRRLHLQDGPIDLIVEAYGGVSRFTRPMIAARRFPITILDELCANSRFGRQPRQGDPPRASLGGWQQQLSLWNGASHLWPLSRRRGRRSLRP
jgi:hypothetical protein